MPSVVEFVLFRLKEGVSEQQLLAASDEFEDGFLSLQKGYVSRKLVRGEEAWADIAMWETMEDAMNAVRAVEDHQSVKAYDACIELSSVRMEHFTLVKDYM